MSDHSKKDERPEFMVALGLLPPYTPEDVKHAYLHKVKAAHPDKGGTVEQFNALQEAYEQAKQYVEFRGDRRGWIAGKMDHYVEVQRVVDMLEELGAEAETDAVDWLQKSFGDFSLLTENIVRVRLADSPDGDKFIGHLIAEHAMLSGLKSIELPGCTVSDEAVYRLAVFEQLTNLDLSRTPVSGNAMAVVDELPLLRTVELEGSKVGWWAKRKVANELRRRAEAGPATPFA